MYGKVLSIPDEAMAEYYRLLPGSGPRGAGAPREASSARSGAGRSAACEHARLAAARHFERVVVQRGAPGEWTRRAFEPGDPAPARADSREFGMSRSEARRLIDQGAVSLDEQALQEGEHDLASERLDGVVLRVGKRRFRKLRAV